MPRGIDAQWATTARLLARGSAFILIGVIQAGHQSPTTACSSRPRPGGIVVLAASSGLSWSLALDRGLVQIVIVMWMSASGQPLPHSCARTVSYLTPRYLTISILPTRELGACSRQGSPIFSDQLLGLIPTRGNINYPPHLPKGQKVSTNMGKYF